MSASAGGPEPLLGRDAVRELDRRAIEERGIASIELMENAARGCATAALELLAGTAGVGSGEPVAVLCGPGNNGGDGFALARLLAAHGAPARALFAAELGRLEKLSDDVRTNARRWRELGGELEELWSPDALAALPARLARAPLVVDALFGTGLVRALGPTYASIVRSVNDSHRPVLAVDLPSGLDADSGLILGAAVCATRTVTFVAAKPGFFRGAGPRLCGRVDVAEIGIPRALVLEALTAGARFTAP